MHRTRKNDSTKALASIAAGGALALGAAAFVLPRLRRRLALRGRVVLITGGSRGLGLEMARVFAAEGARLVLLARDHEELQRARDELRASGATVLVLACDVRDRGQVNAAVATAVDWFGQVDVLVNNAGIIEVGPLEIMGEADYEDALQTHFWGPYYLVQALVPSMRARGEGRIVNIASVGGLSGVPHLGPYVASKYALRGYSESLRAELAKDGVQVTTVCPGLMRTGSPRRARFKGAVQGEASWFRLGAALPVTSMSAARAARRIVRACVRGEAHLVLSVQARLLSAFHGLFPGLTADLFGLVNRALPAPGDHPRTTAVEGETVMPPPGPRAPWWAWLDDRAAVRNHELRAPKTARVH